MDVFIRIHASLEHVHGATAWVVKAKKNNGTASLLGRVDTSLTLQSH